MEKKRKTKIRKWDEVGGVVETEIEESAGSFDETPGAGPSVSRNPMRGMCSRYSVKPVTNCKDS